MFSSSSSFFLSELTVRDAVFLCLLLAYQYDVLMQFCISTTIFTMILKFCQIEVLGGTRSTNEKKSEIFVLKKKLFKFSKIDFFAATMVVVDSSILFGFR